MVTRAREGRHHADHPTQRIDRRADRRFTLAPPARDAQPSMGRIVLTHLCCPACVVRFPSELALIHDRCPDCDEPLRKLAPLDAVGYALAPPVDPEWELADLDALAMAAMVDAAPDAEIITISRPSR